MIMHRCLSFDYSVLYTPSLLVTVQKSINLTCTGSQAPQFLTTAVQAHAVFSSGYHRLLLYVEQLHVFCIPIALALSLSSALVLAFLMCFKNKPVLVVNEQTTIEVENKYIS